MLGVSDRAEPEPTCDHVVLDVAFRSPTSVSALD